MPMLQINNLEVGYGQLQIIKGVTFDLHEGELVTLIGANGAGKSTILKTISGSLKPSNGTITFNGERMDLLPPHKIVAKGIIQVPEGRKLFPGLTVLENLRMGGYLIATKEEFNEKLALVFEMFPILSERSKQPAGTLSGGEQQMCAIARGLMANPKLLMLDEPSLGLAPKIVDSLSEIIVNINKRFNITVLLVEQNVQISCEICTRAFVLENGTIVLNGTGQEMLVNDHVRQAYLGL